MNIVNHIAVKSRYLKVTVLSHTCIYVVYRYIIHSDDHNPYLASMEEFAEKLQDFEPDLLVVGGLQMMDNFPFQSGKRKLVTTFHLLLMWNI